MPFLGKGPGVELHYYDDDFTDPWRPAPAMLLQHGFSRNGRFWYNWVPLLSSQFRILRPDMRGMGESVISEEQFEPSLDIFVEDLRGILGPPGNRGRGVRGRVLRRHPRPELRPQVPGAHQGAGAVQHPLPPAQPGSLRQRRGHGRCPATERGRLVHCNDQQPPGHPRGSAGTGGVVHLRDGPNAPPSSDEDSKDTWTRWISAPT